MLRTVTGTSLALLALALGGAATAGVASPPEEVVTYDVVLPASVDPYGESPAGWRACRVGSGGGGSQKLFRYEEGDVIDLAWSPDGRRVAFGSSAGGGVSVQISSPDGSARRDLTPDGLGATFDPAPAWSPDGSTIAFVRDGDAPTYSPSILVVPVAGGDARTIVPDGNQPAWSPDGSRLVFAYEPPGELELEIAAADGTGAHPVSPTPVVGVAPTWSPDGRLIAFTTGVDSAGLIDIDTIHPDGTGRATLIHDGTSPAWSPDGRRIAFVRKGDIFVADADGSGVRQLTATPGVYEEHPAWRPGELGSAGLRALGACVYLGTASADHLRGSRDADVLYGLAGNDVLEGAGGHDVVFGGPGADRILRAWQADGGPGNDRIGGDASADQLVGGAGDDTISGGAGDDVLGALSPLPSSEAIRGDPGNDRLSGGPGNDFLAGGPGNDRLDPGPGSDTVSGGAGADTVLARDGSRDRIDCGPGRDVAYVDRRDVVRRCERVVRR
jgi:Tol biopolymer transport system component